MITSDISNLSLSNQSANGTIKTCNELQSNKRQLTFVAQPNLVTGKMDWVVQDEDYDFTQEIAR